MPETRLQRTRDVYVDRRTPSEVREDEERAERDHAQGQRGKTLAIGTRPDPGPLTDAELVAVFRERYVVPACAAIVARQPVPLDEQ